MNKQRNATLNVDGKTIDLPIYSGSIGPEVIDIRSLYAKTGMFTFDPGFVSTAACKSDITYIDGDEGVLLYRGYPIEQLAHEVRFPRGGLSDPAGGTAQQPRRRPSSTASSRTTPWCMTS